MSLVSTGLKSASSRAAETLPSVTRCKKSAVVPRLISRSTSNHIMLLHKPTPSPHRVRRQIAAVGIVEHGCGVSVHEPQWLASWRSRCARSLPSIFSPQGT